MADDQTLNFRDADIRAVIDDVARISGRTFIIDPRVNGNVTIISHEELPSDQIFDIFLSTLQVYGYTAMPTLNGAYKIIPEDTAAQMQGFATGKVTGDRIETDIIRIHSVDPELAANIIKPLVNKSGRVIAHPDASLLIVVDYASNMARIRRIIEKLDHDQSVTRMISLKNMSPDDMADAIKDLRGTNQNDNRRHLHLTVVPVAASNMLLLKGDKQAVDKAEGLIKTIDARNADKGAIQVIYLKYADAEQLMPVLEQVSRSVEGKSGADPSQSKGKHPAMGTTVSFHKATNAIVISGPPEVQAAVRDVIDKLDIPRASVLVEAIIVEVSNRAAKELGLQYVFTNTTGSTMPFTAASYSNSAASILQAAGAAVIGSDTTNSDGLDPSRVDAFNHLFDHYGALGGLISKAANGNLFGVILSALDKDMGSNILSTPSVMTLDNEPAKLIVGQEIPVTTGEALGSSNTNPFRTIERRDVGIKLEVRPQISMGQHIKLYIKQEVSSIAGPVSPDQSELITNKREIETTVMADDGEIIVLGGLIERNQQSTINKIPLLGDIPGIGQLFRHKTTSDDKTNLMVFLRPIIIKSARQMGEVTARKYNLMREEQSVHSKDADPALDQMLEQVIGAQPPKQDPGHK
nr:type II secretion system secretin GspD [Kordiimonas marina]